MASKAITPDGADLQAEKVTPPCIYEVRASQSTEDSLTENEVPSSATKFGTWALGSKPVSEEWSDDFVFDDPDDAAEENLVPTIEEKAQNRESIRSVKVPQSIMDRQQSVHIQFGQVRDFMLLVEELKRLRIRGADLGLLDSHSRQLWDDAESIIDLATVNDEDDALPRPPSPLSSDMFGDETPPPKRQFDDEMGRTNNRRSISNPATPPYGRPRGESLQTKSFLQAIHQHRSGVEISPTVERPRREHERDKLPFDTQDLRDLVVRAGVINRALKEIVRKSRRGILEPGTINCKISRASVPTDIRSSKFVTKSRSEKTWSAEEQKCEQLP